VVLVPLSIVQAWTGSYPKLTKDMPTASLFYYPVILSVMVCSLIQFGFQFYFFIDVRRKIFYYPLDP